jgi:hypothetical protein
MRTLRYSWLLLASASLSWAQDPAASVFGIVTDQSQAVIQSASITATQVKTGVAFHAKSDSSGAYSFPSLPPGQYTVSASAPDFQAQLIQGIQLEIGARTAFHFSLGPVTKVESVDVVASQDSLIYAVGSSVGNVINADQVLILPLVSRNALGLSSLQAGTFDGNFSGNRIGALNITIDGINTQDQLVNSGVYSTSYTSVDIIEEFRVVTSPVDAQYGRGSGQIQARTRSGTNQFHGSLFSQHKNTVLNANNWFNNQRGLDRAGNPVSPRNQLIENNFGARLGGPIRRNKTFFHANYEGNRFAERNAISLNVLTPEARAGRYRFFPGARNGNADALIPTVDLAGNPVRPASATAELQTVNLLQYDPNRSILDPTGITARALAQTPLPNNFRAGDGLNQAAYFWMRPRGGVSDLSRVKIDHHFSSRHRLDASWQFQAYDASNYYQPQSYPNSPGGTDDSTIAFLSVGFDSTLSPRMLNQFRGGFNRQSINFLSPWDRTGSESIRQGTDGFIPVFASFSNPVVIATGQGSQGRTTPIYQFGDTLSFLSGRHSLKAGGEWRDVSTNIYNAFGVPPQAFVGSGVLSNAPINAIPGIGANNTLALSILNDLTGTLNSKQQTFNLAAGANLQFVPGARQLSHWYQRELSWFVQDQWQIRKTLSLTLGLRWEYYGVPYEEQGRLVTLQNGSGSIFGLSGSDFSAMFRPGELRGSLTSVELVGRNSPNPSRSIVQPDRNNFAPVAGLTWQLPRFTGESVLRIGYGLSFERNSFANLSLYSDLLPGLRTTSVFRPSSPLSFSNAPVLTPQVAPLATVPLTDRAQTMRAWNSGLVTPYIQNWNASLVHRLPAKLMLDIRYVGSKGTQLLRSSNINEVNIFENGILDAYRATQAGGNAPLFDRVFQGLNLAGFGIVDGQAGRTGSAAFRFLLPDAFANNNAGAAASYLNTSTVAGAPGSLLRRAGLPENFVVANPQFLNALYLSNFSNSTYHSLQLEVTRKFSGGLSFQANWTWSRTLGDEEGSSQDLINDYRTNRNRTLDKRLLNYHRSHVFRSNWIYELPAGRGRRFGKSMPRLVDAAIGGWDLSAIYNHFTGQPLSFLASNSSFNSFTADSTASITGPMPAGISGATVDGNIVRYFSGVSIVPDPYRQQLTTTQNIRGASALFAIAGPDGNVLLHNPAPGNLGNLSPNSFFGPSIFRLDFRLTKRFQFNERVDFQLNVEATDALNTPQWGNPVTNINNTNFGRITTATGARVAALNARIRF